MKVNLTLTLVAIFIAASIGFSQNKVQLNVSESQRSLSLETVDAKNMPPSLSIADFKLHEAIRNNEINKGDVIVFNLEDFENKEGKVIYKNTDVNNVTSYIVKFEAHQFAQAIITVHPSEYLITIDIPELKKQFTTIVSSDRQQYYIAELDPLYLREINTCGIELIEEYEQPQPVKNKPAEDREPSKNFINGNSPEADQRFLMNTNLECNNPNEDDVVDIKILVIYTQTSLTESGSQAGMNNRLAQAMARANTASINSNLGMNFILAHSELTDYVEYIAEDGTYDARFDLFYLRRADDGFMDNVHQLRNTHAADFVHLITRDSDFSGIANVLTFQDGDDNAVFGLTRVDVLSVTDTFIHEIGHNMGAMHSTTQNVQPGPNIFWRDWPENLWSAGSRFQDANSNYFTSIMSYSAGFYYDNGAGTNATPINYFSTPLINYQGQPIGDAVNADNSRTFKTLKQLFSKYRDERSLQYCAPNRNIVYNDTITGVITNVSLSNLTNSSTDYSKSRNVRGATRYTDYSFLKSCLVKESTYPMSVNLFTGTVDHSLELLVWIDYNNDYVFDLDELVYSSGPTPASNNTFNFDITPPLTAFTGDVRMRIRYNDLSDLTSNSTPCGDADKGEVEDYTIVLTENCTITSVIDYFDTDNIEPSSASLSWSTLNNATYTLRYRKIGNPGWTVIGDIAQSSTTLTELDFATEYEAQILSKCSNGVPSAYASSLFFTTKDLIYCDATAALPADSDPFTQLTLSLNSNEIFSNSIGNINQGYIDFTTLSMLLSRGAIYAFDASDSNPNQKTYELIVWIDFNQNGDFSDEGERLLRTIPKKSPWTGDLAIPTTALLGETRMRIYLGVYQGPSVTPSPCALSSFGQVQVQDYTVVIYDDYLYYENAWTPENPSGISLGSDNILVMDGETSITTNTSADGVTIKPSGKLHINEGVGFSINGDLTNRGVLELNSVSNSYSSLLVNGNVSGDAVYKRYVNMAAAPGTTTGNNDLVSAPVTGQSFGDFRAANTNLLTGTIGGIGPTLYLFGPFDNSNNAFVNFSAADDETTLEAGVGYRTGSTDASTYTFVGKVETGSPTVTINAPAAGSKWNLIGNPYPSYINSMAFLNANNSVSNPNSGLDPEATAIYGYNNNTYSGDGSIVGNYTIINNISNNDVNIAPGQGFFVAATPTGGTIQFTPAMRTTIGTDDFILGRSSDPNYSFKLGLIGDETHTTSFYFNEHSSLGLDPGYDAAVFGNGSANYPIYSHLVEDNTGRPMAMQSLNHTDLSNLSIPLGINANMGEQLTFSMIENNLPNYVEVYLEDTIAQSFTLLNTGDYILTPNSNLNGTGRFYLRVGTVSLSTSALPLDHIQIYNPQQGKNIIVAGVLDEDTDAHIYDMQGRLVQQNVLTSRLSQQAINVEQLSAGIYVVVLNNKRQSKMQKVILR